MIKVTVHVKNKSWRAQLPTPATWAKGVTKAFAEANILEDRPCTLLLTNDKTLQELNRDFRLKDHPTNILSFPAGDQDMDYLGDMAMAFETCEREAQREGKTFQDHATHLLIHGLLHLLGHDHMEDAEAEAMEALEVKLLASLAIGNPYEEGAPCTI